MYWGEQGNKQRKEEEHIQGVILGGVWFNRQKEKGMESDKKR